MKKVALVVLSSVAALYATSITVPTGWSLLGAINGISPSQIACANTVWTYNNGGSSWNLYVKTPVSGNYGFNTISAINMGQGFWVNNTSGSSCILDFNATTPVVTPTSYDAYGFHFLDVKNDSRYTVANNNVSYNSATTTFSLNAYLSDAIDSRAQLTTNLASPLSAINATTRLVTGTTSYNQSQVIIGNLDINSSTVGYAGITLKNNGATAWFETNDITTGETITQPYKHTFSTANMVGENIISHIDVNGSTITYSISNGSTINASDTYTTTANGITIHGGIKKIAIRARTDDRNVTTTPGNVTTVQFSNLQATPYTGNISSTPATTLNFADLSSFIMLENTDKSYTKITKSASTFSATDYEYNDSIWESYSGISGTVSGNRITMTSSDMNGGVYEFAISGTQKINSAFGASFTDLYISQATTTCITAPSAFEYNTWGQDNPTYYNSSTHQQVPIINLTTLVAGFTAPDQGMRFGSNSSPMFLNSGGKVVAGVWNGSYYTNDCTGDCRIFVRTTTEVGTWEQDTSKISVEVPKQSITFEVLNQGGIYRIQEGWKDKAGAVDSQLIFSGTQAVDAVVQTYLSSQASQPTAN